MKKLFLSVLLILLIVLPGCGSGQKSVSDTLHNSQVFYDAVDYKRLNVPVLIIELDGFGYSTYQRALADNILPFLSTLPVKQAYTYYPSISPVGLAAMVTGEAPEANGIQKRGDRELKVKDIFSIYAKAGKSTAYIEGDMKLINTSLEPVLCADLDGDGLTDNEVLAAALQALKAKPDLIFVHFHGIDDVSHKYNPKSKEALARTELLDGYCQELVKNWQGAVIITADHGQHTENGLGVHGSLADTDMEIPYINTIVNMNKE